MIHVSNQMKARDTLVKVFKDAIQPFENIATVV